MEQQSCRAVKTLKETALRTATVNLWIESVLETIAKKDYKWCVEEKAACKLSKHELPPKIKRQIMGLVHCACFNVMQWKQYTAELMADENALFNSHTIRLLQLTERYDIDFEKTAENLAECEMLDVCDRFKIACWYCLEDWIRLLWEELPAEMITLYAEKRRVLEDVNMVSYWCFVLREDGPNLEKILEEESSSLPTFYRKALIKCVIKRNQLAAQHFFKKLDYDDSILTL